MITRAHYVSALFLTLAIVLAVATGTLVGVASSQPPAPSTRKRESNPPQRQAEPAQSQPAPTAITEQGTESRPVVVRISKSKDETQREQDDRSQEATNKRWMLFVTALTMGVVGYQTVVLFLQNKIMEKQNCIIEKQSRTTEAMLATNKEIERAYIYLTHSAVTVEGARPDSEGGIDMSQPTGISLTITIANAGRTPGDLLGGFIGWRIAPEPGLPDVTRVINDLTPAFLLPTKDVSFGLTITEDKDTLKRLIVTRGGNDHLWLIGELDYADRFGQFHTAGYGRRFNPHGPSFVFVRDTGPFNYDRPMTVAKKAHYGKLG